MTHAELLRVHADLTRQTAAVFVALGEGRKRYPSPEQLDALHRDLKRIAAEWQDAVQQYQSARRAAGLPPAPVATPAGR